MFHCVESNTVQQIVISRGGHKANVKQDNEGVFNKLKCSSCNVGFQDITLCNRLPIGSKAKINNRTCCNEPVCGQCYLKNTCCNNTECKRTFEGSPRTQLTTYSREFSKMIEESILVECQYSIECGNIPLENYDQHVVTSHKEINEKSSKMMPSLSQSQGEFARKVREHKEEYVASSSHDAGHDVLNTAANKKWLHASGCWLSTLKKLGEDDLDMLVETLKLNKLIETEERDRVKLSDLLCTCDVDKLKIVIAHFIGAGCRNYESINKYYSSMPQDSQHMISSSTPEDSQYITSYIFDVMVNSEDRQGRINIFRFIDACQKTHLKLLQEKLPLHDITPYEISNAESDKLNMLKNKVIKELVFSGFTVERILQVFNDSKLKASGLVKKLTEVIDISKGHYHIPEHVRKKSFDKCITRGDDTDTMLAKLNSELGRSDIQFRLGVMLVSIGEIAGLGCLYGLYTLLEGKRIMVKEFILALADANLFKGEVKSIIEQHYGDGHIDDVQPEINAVNMSYPYPLVKRSVGEVLTDWKNPAERHNLIECLKSCSIEQLKYIASEFLKLTKRDLEEINTNDFMDIMHKIAYECLSNELLYNFFQNHKEIFPGFADRLVERNITGQPLDINSLKISNINCDFFHNGDEFKNIEGNDLKCLAWLCDLSISDISSVFCFTNILNSMTYKGEPAEQLLRGLEDAGLTSACEALRAEIARIKLSGFR